MVKKIIIILLLFCHLVIAKDISISKDELLLAEWKGSVYLAKILDIKDNKIHITYPFYDNKWNEWVKKDRIIKPLKIVMASDQCKWFFAGLIEKNDMKYKSYFHRRQKKNMKMISFSDFVEILGVAKVKWQGQWYNAGILKKRNNKYYIRYEGYGSEWDEWVTTDRIKIE